MNKKALFVLPILSVLALAGCGSNKEPSSTPPVSSSEPATTSEAQPSSSSVDPNANKRVTEALFTSEITSWGLFGLDRKVTATATNTYVSGTTTTIMETTLKVDEVKHSAHRVTKTADGTVVNQSDGAYVLEKNQQDNKIYYKEIYTKGNDGKWSKNTNQQEFKFANLYDLGFFADKLAYSSFTFDETSGTYKCASLNTTIYETPYLIENIEIAFENNKVKSISNKVSSQNPEVPGSSTVSVVFTNHGTTTVTLPEVQEEPTSKELSDIFLDVGEQAAYIAANKERPTKKGLTGDMNEHNRKSALSTPAIFLYLVGKLYEHQEFDCLEKISSFRGVFDVTMGTNTIVLDVTMDLMIKVDKDNGKLYLYGIQDMIQGTGTSTMTVTAPLYMEVNYNFEEKVVVDFHMYAGSIMASYTSFNYYEYVGGVARELDVNVKDDDYNQKHAVYEAAFQEFDAKVPEKTTATDPDLAHRYGQAFIDAQNFTNEVIGQVMPMQFHED